MLVFVGLGIKGEESLTIEGLKEAQKADEVYAELYTSRLPELKLERLEEIIGKKVRLLRRQDLENGDELLRRCLEKRVALLVPGDPMVATTHVSLRLRAISLGIATKVVHSSSIVSAVSGITGLQNYKFGQSATIPLPEIKSAHPYRVLSENSKRGLHTLFFLDIREDGTSLTINEAVKTLLSLEEKHREGVFTPNRLVVGVARAGAGDCVVKGDRAFKLLEEDFGPPPHSLVVPGRLHFMEAEALKVLAGVPEDVVRELEG